MANWKPVRHGAIYCSPACGYNCTHAQYVATIKAAENCLARMKTPGWKIRVHENMGWYWSLVKTTKTGGCFSVRGGQLPYREDPSKGFHAMLSMLGHTGACDANFYDEKQFNDPNEAVRYRIRVAHDRLAPVLALLEELK